MRQHLPAFGKLSLLIAFFSVVFLATPTQGWALEVDPATHHETEQGEEVIHHDHDGDHEEAHAEVHAGDHEEGHHTDMSPLFFIITALLVGAAVRHFMRNIPLPFTVLLLLIGLGMGILVRLGYFEIWHIGSLTLDMSFITASFHWAANIDPHMLLYVFLPILIFEAAFAMDVHTFKKSVVNAIILAVPGIIIALILTAAFAMGLTDMGLGLEKWTWPVALMFGAVISATDPVAVVALLKDLGASKKLGTLIEGESLLNDGTAIVIFMVFFTSVTGATADNHPVVEFGRVAFGGTLLGLVIAGVIIAWVKRVFNDALVEISVIVAAAFVTFFIAEYFMHVSGVLGLVALGLAMASVGRTRISPEVGHFLHEFWELAAFMANVLIFLIVGVVVAQRTVFSANDFLILGMLYVAIHVVRAIVILVCYPFMKNTGYGLPVKDAYIVWYGALRGAIGLALALIVAGEPSIDQEIRDQFLFLTAGIVTLTLLINATTIKFLVQRLGLLKLPAAKALTVNNAHAYLRKSAENHATQLRSDRFLKRADWNAVEEYLPEVVEVEIEGDGEIETIAETRRRILEKEKSSYWKQFKDGLLGATAVQKLSGTIDEMLDEGGLNSLSHRKDLEEMWNTPKLLNRLQTIPLIGKMAERAFFERLAVSYDSAVGFVVAQEEAIKLVESMYRSKKGEDTADLSIIESEINENKIQGQTFLRNLRNAYPEIYNAISTRQAIRSLLNYELHTVERLQKKGQIDGGEASKMISTIEARMKKLMETPPKAKLPDTAVLLESVTWVKDLEDNTSTVIADRFQTRIFSAGEKMMKEGENFVIIIVRGKARVVQNGKLIGLAGKGDVIGELAALGMSGHQVSATAESPVTALALPAADVSQIMKESDDFTNRLWSIAAKRIAGNVLAEIEPYKSMSERERNSFVAKGKMIDPRGEAVSGGKLILIVGKVGSTSSPALLDSLDGSFSTDAKVFYIPE
jgi:NhaP-type Na+/H+ or K+/H+ antiporter/CRP-like cAMP-binding protein